MIILIQGSPGSGKTTLASKLSKELGILHISKDDLKETFFDSVGYNDPDLSRKLGMISNKVLFKIIEKVTDDSSHLMIESNFDPKLGKEELEAALSGKNIKLLEIFLYATNEVLISRFESRWSSGERHRGHVDNLRLNDLKEYLKQRQRPISIAKDIIEIDTECSSEIVYELALKEIKQRIS